MRGRGCRLGEPPDPSLRGTCSRSGDTGRPAPEVMLIDVRIEPNPGVLRTVGLRGPMGRGDRAAVPGRVGDAGPIEGARAGADGADLAAKVPSLGGICGGIVALGDTTTASIVPSSTGISVCRSALCMSARRLSFALSPRSGCTDRVGLGWARERVGEGVLFRIRSGGVRAVEAASPFRTRLRQTQEVARKIAAGTDEFHVMLPLRTRHHCAILPQIWIPASRCPSSQWDRGQPWTCCCCAPESICRSGLSRFAPYCALCTEI